MLAVAKTQEQTAAMKARAATAAVDYIESGDVVGVGTGSTTEFFINELAKLRGKIDGVVASSEDTATKLRAHNLPLLDLNQVGGLPIYVDGTDEATRHLHLVKGGGGALTREKIIAEASEKFICIADESKLVKVLGAFPLPVEVIPMAQSLVARAIVKLGGQPELRANFSSDNGNLILDIRNFNIDNPLNRESELNQIPGVVAVGLFARRGADILLLGNAEGVEVIK